MNMCSGGCIKGPTVEDESISRFKVKLDMEETIEKDPAEKSEVEEIISRISFQKLFMDRSPREAMPTEAQIQDILKKTGKTKPEDELNCGACGYSTCREKAIAVFQKKAELGM